MKTLIYHLLVVLVLLTITSCSQQSAKGTDADREKLFSSNKEFVVEMGDFTFLNAPDSVVSGLTTIKSINAGIYPHNAVLMRLDNGHTYEDLLQHIDQYGHEFPEWAIQVGGPAAPLPGGSSEVTLDLRPGNYALICIVPIPANEPHFMKGMTKALTVIESGKMKEEEPKADISLVMKDYSFTVSPKIQAGRQTIKVENTADQPHEFILVQLQEGKTAEDMINWLGQTIQSKGGPLPEAPGTLLNGVSPMNKGSVNFVTVDFKPGEYALICPYPDTKSGNPHFVHGMTQQFTVE